MLYTIFNAVLYSILLIFYWKKWRKIDNGLLLLIVWTTVSIFSALLYASDPNEWKLQLWPFLYVFLIFVLLNRQFIFPGRMNTSVKDVVWEKNKLLDIGCIIYILFALYNLLTQSDSFSSLDLNNVEQNASIAYYNTVHTEAKGDASIFAYISRMYVQELVIFALIMMYNYICQKRFLMSLLLAIAIIVPPLLRAALTGNRSTIFTLTMLLVSGYLLYRKYISKKAKRAISLAAVFLGAFFVLYVLAVTISRFDNSQEGAQGSLLSYMGQSMLNFNYGIADCLETPMFGARTFSRLYGMLGINATLLSEMVWNTIHTNYGFPTVVGMLCLDFGYSGTVILAIILPFIIKKMSYTETGFCISGLYVYLYFLNRMYLGVFSNHEFADVSYFTNFLVYLVLWFFFDRRQKKIYRLKTKIQ